MHGWTENDLLIVAMQSCDVVAESLEVEPFIEMIKATPTNSANGNLINAKNPRKLQIDAPEPIGKKFLHLDIHDRAFFDRRFIETTKLDPHCLDAAQLQALKTWLGARYNRASFPDKFVDWAKNGINKMCKGLDKQAGGNYVCKYVEGIYMKVDPDAEVADGNSYDLSCFALISPDTPQKAEEKIEESMKLLVHHLDTDKIQVQTEDSLVMQTTEVTVYQLKSYKKYYFDHLSLKRREPI